MHRYVTQLGRLICHHKPTLKVVQNICVRLVKLFCQAASSFIYSSARLQTLLYTSGHHIAYCDDYSAYAQSRSPEHMAVTLTFAASLLATFVLSVPTHHGCSKLPLAGLMWFGHGGRAFLFVILRQTSCVVGS